MSAIFLYRTVLIFFFRCYAISDIDDVSLFSTAVILFR